MTRTYTPAALAALILPGDLPGLLDGWVGPIIWSLNDHPGRRGVWGPIGPSSEPERMGVVKAGDMRPDPIVSLPLFRWECRVRVVAWLMEGERCPACGGAATVDAGAGGASVSCLRCRDGWLRPPADLRWALDWPGQPLPAWQSAAILHASALRVVAGMGPATDIVADWTPTFEGPKRLLLTGARRNNHLSFVHSRGWHLYGGPAGKDLSDAGKAAADAAALAAGHALLDGDTLRIAIPD